MMRISGVVGLRISVQRVLLDRKPVSGGLPVQGIADGGGKLSEPLPGPPTADAHWQVTSAPTGA
ncbi:hypothetical protein OG735_18255 [Streptomyces sp. NBC_01210]|uniref:hypothetical protein n=1 Tax=Streptomyces sp. NBC_01210 TaxID=2903774 RepID=UPI002E127201|nr:hypothetical protein OG735_18255 [Streptomyces sp. NBC_01210]